MILTPLDDLLPIGPQNPFISLILLMFTIIVWVSSLGCAPRSILDMPKFLFQGSLLSSFLYKSVHYFLHSLPLLVCDTDTGFIYPVVEPEPHNI